MGWWVGGCASRRMGGRSKGGSTSHGERPPGVRDVDKYTELTRPGLQRGNIDDIKVATEAPISRSNERKLLVY